MRSLTRFLRITLLSSAIVCAVSSDALADSFLNQGIQQYTKRDFKTAILLFEKSIAANSSIATPFYYEALSYSQLGQSDKAKALYLAVYRQFPGSPEAKLAATYLERLSAVASINVATPSAALRAAAAPTASEPMGDLTTFAAANASTDDMSRLPTDSSVPFTRGQDGHLYVDSQVNGRTIKMMFDTGASTCLFGKNQLLLAGITPRLLNQRIAMGGVGSHTNAASPMVVDLKVGGIVRHMPIMVQDEFSIAPLLGQTFYNGYEYDIDNQAGVIRFTKKSAGRSSQGFDSIEVPFSVVGNNLVVNAEINGQQQPMYFDTGAAINLIDAVTFHRLGIPIPSDAQQTMVGGVGGSSPGVSFRVREIRLGGIQKNDVPVTVVFSGGPPLPLLGQPFFRDRRFTIDNERHVIRFAR